jgi:hypothetical protein
MGVLAACVVCLFTVLFFAVIFGDDFSLPSQAKKRARRLFVSKLDSTQRRSWTFRRRVEVVASSGRRYTMKPYGTFNIWTDTELFCVHVDGNVPNYDKLLAQRLLLEADEQLFIAVANRRQR